MARQRRRCEERACKLESAGRHRSLEGQDAPKGVPIRRDSIAEVKAAAELWQDCGVCASIGPLHGDRKSRCGSRGKPALHSAECWQDRKPFFRRRLPQSRVQADEPHACGTMLSPDEPSAQLQRVGRA